MAGCEPLAPDPSALSAVDFSPFFTVKHEKQPLLVGARSAPAGRNASIWWKRLWQQVPPQSIHAANRVRRLHGDLRTMRRHGLPRPSVSYGVACERGHGRCLGLVVDDNYRALRLRATGALLRVMA